MLTCGARAAAAARKGHAAGLRARRARSETLEREERERECSGSLRRFKAVPVICPRGNAPWRDAPNPIAVVESRKRQLNSTRRPGGGRPTQSDLLQCHPGIMMCEPVVRGTRLTVEQILEDSAAGHTVEYLLDAYPRLTREEVRAALGFAARSLGSEVVCPMPDRAA